MSYFKTFLFTLSIKPNFLFLREYNENKVFTAFFVLSQPKLYFIFTNFFKEAIVIFSFMYYFWRNTPTDLPIAAVITHWSKQ